MDHGDNISLTNVEDEESFSYSHVVIRGSCVKNDNEPNKPSFIVVSRVVASSTPPIEESKRILTKCSLIDDKFVFVLELYEGKNVFSFETLEYSCNKTFYYLPSTTVKLVTPLLIICRGQEISNIDHICRKIKCGCYFIQTLIAETLFLCGHGKKTFTIDSERTDIRFKSDLPWSATADMTDEDLWNYIGREIIDSENGHENRKYLAFLMKNVNSGTNLAIGGGGLALCDLRYLDMWPGSLNDFYNNLNSSNEIAFGTALGVACHELCHTFDVGHTNRGIMGRDFDRVINLFSTHPSNNINTFNFSRDDTQLSIECSKYEFWFCGCDILLAKHKWLQINCKTITNQIEINHILTYNPTRSIINSVYGIAVIHLRNILGYIIKYWKFDSKNRKHFFILPMCDVSRGVCIIIEDHEGNLIKHEIGNNDVP